jgi:hypothetical protein
MYDAKKVNSEKKQDLRFNSISDRAYFNRGKADAFMSTKISYVPSETLFPQ